MRILVIEDDPNIGDVIRRGLETQHYSVDVATDGEEGEELALINQYDLIILDRMLPKMDGRTVCRNLRDADVAVPVLMLTAMDAIDDKISGLDAGADDYLTKPFHFGELLARVRSMIRRQTGQKKTEICVGDLALDTVTRSVTRAGRSISLTAKEFALLEYFVMNAGKVLTREAISEHVWDMNFDPQSNVIDSFIRFLRLKIDKDFDHPLIHTLRGVGYRFSDEGAR
ncbi:MAG: two component transcriptional regulator, winged helix family [Chlorobi bacterium]|nr:two component transcriptional regulator, winged helix family [Chlorobiota bacterium]